MAAPCSAGVSRRCETRGIRRSPPDLQACTVPIGVERHATVGANDSIPHSWSCPNSENLSSTHSTMLREALRCPTEEARRQKTPDSFHTPCSTTSVCFFLRVRGSFSLSLCPWLFRSFSFFLILSFSHYFMFSLFLWSFHPSIHLSIDRPLILFFPPDHLIGHWTSCWAELGRGRRGASISVQGLSSTMRRVLTVPHASVVCHHDTTTVHQTFSSPYRRKPHKALSIFSSSSLRLHLSECLLDV